MNGKQRLGRDARGLPRYMMDVGWWRHPNFVGVPLESLFLFSAIIGYSTEHLTDGHVPAHPEDLAAALGLRASAVRKALRPLVEAGRLNQEGGELVVPFWEEHNPTAEEVDRFASTKSSAGAKGNHRRWHVSKGVWLPDECEHCLRDGPPSQMGSLNGSQVRSHQ